MTDDIIKELHEIRKIGNYSIHDIVEKITPTFAEQWIDRIKIILTPLLISYQKLKDKSPQITPERKYQIKLKVGLIKKNKVDNN